MTRGEMVLFRRRYLNKAEEWNNKRNETDNLYVREYYEGRADACKEVANYMETCLLTEPVSADT